MNDLPFSRRNARAGAAIILLAGVVVRLKVYFQNRSLFLDEANLARNIVERPLSGFTTALDYQQYAPPLFLSTVKGAVGLLGPSEFGLRIVPLLASLGTLWLVFLLAQKIVSAPWVRLIPLFLTAFSYEMLRYGTECKQYSLDALGGVALVCLALHWPPVKMNHRRWLGWGIIGSIAIWFTMPIVFVLAGSGCYYGFTFLRKQNYRQLPALSLTIACWLLSFGLYYWYLLRPEIDSDYLNTYHKSYFLPLLPTNSTEWSTWSALLLSLFRNAAGYTVVSYMVSIPLFLWGVIALIKKEYALIWLLGLPILACLVASGLEQYSLLPRLTLFMIPLFGLLMAVGTDDLWGRRRWTPWLFTILWLPVLPLSGGLVYLALPLEIENTREVLKATMNSPKGDLVYVHHEGVPAATYYRDYHPDSSAFRQKPMHLSHWDETPEMLATRDTETAWIVYSHLINANTRTEMKRQLEVAASFGTLVDTVEATGATGVLFRNRKSEIGNRRSEVRGQRSEVRSRRSEVRDRK